MTSREKKLAAARKKLRAYIGQNREHDGTRATGSSNASSPSPGPAVNDAHRADSPVDRARLAWERRETLEIIDAQVPEHGLQCRGQYHFYAQNTPDAPQRPSSADCYVNTNFIADGSQSPISNARQAPAEQPLLRHSFQEQQPENSQLQRELLLQEQLRRQEQAINVLVAERNDTQTALSRVQAQLHEKSDAFEELKQKHMDAINRIRDMEVNPPHMVHSHISAVEDEKRNHELQMTQQKVSMLEEQLMELRQKLEGKKAECDSMAQDVRQLRNDLSVADVRIQQLSISETSVSNIRVEELEAQKKELEGRVGLLERRLQAAAVEGEQAGHRFQMYADQCTSQITALRTQVRDLTEENLSLKSAKEEIQKQVDGLQDSVLAARSAGGPLESKVAALIEENAELAKTLTQKEGEVVSLQGVCAESGERLATLQNELQDLMENRRLMQAQAVAGHADPALLAAMESDKVAASRAVSQNQRLKETLADLEAAYVRISNEKSDLVDKLTTQEHENKELRKQLEIHSQDHEHSHCENGHDHHHDNDIDSDEDLDVDSLRQQVALLRKDKTELILRLQALSGNNQLTYQHKQDHEHHQNGGHDHKEHHHEHEHDHSGDCEHEHDHNEKSNIVSHEEVEQLRRAVEQLQEDKAELIRRLGAPSEDPQVLGLLEEKLRKTMEEIAGLDEEKQRLEHLVLQLQGETETIGEYISLYQKQRQLLRKRSLEKDEQLQQLTRDREELKEKLSSLNQLVHKFIGSDPNTQTAHNVDAAEEATAERIRALITEIENNNVVNAHHHGVEHCFCCSGQLQTV